MRQDVHSPKSIIPEDYEFIMAYQGATSIDGWPIPSYNIMCDDGNHTESGFCCVVGLRTIAKVKWGGNGGTCKCSVCGTPFIYGEVWKHKSGEYIHVGHICAEKYGLLADYSADYNNKKAAYIQREIRLLQKAKLLKDYPQLTEEMITHDHYIVNDIMSRYYKWCNISDKQVALIVKLSSDNQEKRVPAPCSGKREFFGEVISVKEKYTKYGMATKATIKVRADGECYWLAYCTLPKKYVNKEMKNKNVKVTGTVYNDYGGSFVTVSRPKMEYGIDSVKNLRRGVTKYLKEYNSGE